MGRTVVVRAAAAAAAIVCLAACGGTVNCGACPGPLWLTVRRAPSVPSGPGVRATSGSGGPTSSTAAPPSVRVCVTGLACEEEEWHEGATVYLHPARGVRPSDLEGRVVRVTVREPGGELAGVGTLAYTDGGDDTCSCSYSTAEVQVDA